MIWVHVKLHRFSLEWAFDWVTMIIGQEMPSLVEDVDNRRKIKEAIQSLATMEPNERTMSRLQWLINDQQLQGALEPYCQGGAYGNYFDNIEEGIQSANITTFEMGEIMEKIRILESFYD